MPSILSATIIIYKHLLRLCKKMFIEVWHKIFISNADRSIQVEIAKFRSRA